MKIGSTLLVLILSGVLIFILGVNHGKTVKVADEVMQIISTITPVKSQESFESENWTYKEYINTDCGFSFIYVGLMKIQESTSEATLSYADDPTVKLICSDKQNNSIKQDANKAIEIRLQQLNTKGFPMKDSNNIYFTVKNPFMKKYVTFTVNKQFLPLIEKTLRFNKPS